MISDHSVCLLMFVKKRAQKYTHSTPWGTHFRNFERGSGAARTHLFISKCESFLYTIRYCVRALLTARAALSARAEKKAVARVFMCASWMCMIMHGRGLTWVTPQAERAQHIHPPRIALELFSVWWDGSASPPNSNTLLLLAGSFQKEICLPAVQTHSHRQRESCWKCASWWNLFGILLGEGDGLCHCVFFLKWRENGRDNCSEEHYFQKTFYCYRSSHKLNVVPKKISILEWWH